MTQSSHATLIPELEMRESFLSTEDANQLLHTLINEVAWHKDFYEAFGRRFEIPRLQAWFAEAGIQYSYSNNLLPVQPWREDLIALKKRVEAEASHSFNSVLVTYYRTGDDHVTWHADDEQELGDLPVIVSISLGAMRQFCFRRQDQENADTHTVILKSGDLLLMKPEFQHHWQHCVPVEPQVREPRINLTFRNVVNRD